MSYDLLPDTTPPDPRAEHARKVAALRAALEGRAAEKASEETSEGKPTLAETAQRLDDALARDQKWDLRISQGERELWDRAAQAVGVSTSEFVRAVVNHNAEQTIAEAYAATE